MLVWIFQLHTLTNLFSILLLILFFLCYRLYGEIKIKKIILLITGLDTSFAPPEVVLLVFTGHEFEGY